MTVPLIESTEAGLFCPIGDFHIDPWRPVRNAVVTHAHADHLRRGCDRYLVAAEGETLARARLDPTARITSLPYGEPLHVRGVRVSLHPAGHILGAAQVRLEHRGRVAVVAGDYKLDDDPTCAPLEMLECHEFVTEATFGLPLFRWPDWRSVIADVNGWWRENQDAGRPSVLFAYACGKAQRLLASVDSRLGPIFAHGAVRRMNQAYREAGVDLPETPLAVAATGDNDWSRALIVAPPSARATPWMRRFGNPSTAMVSGWMRVRGIRRRRAVDRGFVLSDHADWRHLLQVIRATSAEKVHVTHGYSESLARYLREQGHDASVLPSAFRGELLEQDESLDQEEALERDGTEEEPRP